MKFVLLFLLLAIARASSQLDIEEQNLQTELDPLNETGQNEQKNQQKRTIFGPGPYIYGRTRHVGIHPLGFKYVLGYGPIHYNYVLKPGVIKPVLKPAGFKPVLKPVWKPVKPVKPAVTLLKPVLQTEGWKPIVKPVFKPVVAIKPVHSHVHGHSHVLSNGHVHGHGHIHTHSHGHVHTPVVVQKPVVVAEKPVVVAQKPVVQPLVPVQSAVSILQFPNPFFKPIAVGPQHVLPITPLQPVPAPAVIPEPAFVPGPPAVLPPPGVFPAPAVFPNPPVGAPILPEFNPLLRPLNPLHLHLLNSKLPLPPAVPIPNNGLAVPLPIHFQQTTQLKPVLPAPLPPVGIHSHLDLFPANPVIPNHLHIDQGHIHANSGLDLHDQHGHHLHLDQGHLHLDQGHFHLDQGNFRLEPGHLHADLGAHVHTNQHVHPEAPNIVHTEQHLHQNFHHIHPAPQLPLYLPNHPAFKPLPPIAPSNSIQTEFSATFPKYPLVQT